MIHPIFTPEEECEIIEIFLYNYSDFHGDPIWDIYPDELSYTIQETETLYGNYVKDDEEIEVESISTEYSSDSEQINKPLGNLKPSTVPMEQGQSSTQGQTSDLNPTNSPLKEEYGNISPENDERSNRDYEIRRRPAKEDYSTFGVPTEYQTHNDKIRIPDSLNLDCQINRGQLLETWQTAVGLVILTNSQINNDVNVTHSYLAHKMTGNVKVWYSGLSPEQRQIITHRAVSGYDYLTHLVKAIHAEFVGLSKDTAPEQVRQREHQEAEFHLQNMTICDPCLIDNFFCEYEKYYHKIMEGSKPYYRDMFLNKIPGILGIECRKNWHNKDASVPNTLAGAKRIIDEYVIKECEYRTKLKQLKLKTKLCCSKLDPKLPGHYGCEQSSNKFSKKKTKYIKSRKRFYKKKFNRKIYDKTNYSQKRKFFRRKKPENKKSEKAKYCPKGKTSCRCWLCNEEGHYANACPRRQSANKKDLHKIKLLEFAFANHLEPIESSNSETESFYYLSEKEDSSSQNESPSDHNWYSDTSSDSD